MTVTHRLHAIRLVAAILGLSACSRAPDAGFETLEPWPFTVETVVLSCEPASIPPDVSQTAAETLRRHGGKIFVTTEDGRRFAVNGTARAAAPLMTDIQAVVDTSPVIRRGLELCRGEGGSVRLVRSTAGTAAPPPTVGPPAYTLRPQEIGDGYFATAQANEVINGVRPELTLACERGHAPMVLINVGEPPRTPPPLRGVYASFAIAGASTQRLEMSWGTETMWTLRSGDERREDAALARAILAGGEVRFTGAARYMPEETLTWDFAQFGEELGRIRVECGA